jgi:hypothetical protein
LIKLSSIAIFETARAIGGPGIAPANEMVAERSPPVNVTPCSSTFFSEIAEIANGVVGGLAG